MLSAFVIDLSVELVRFFGRMPRTVSNHSLCLKALKINQPK